MDAIVALATMAISAACAAGGDSGSGGCPTGQIDLKCDGSCAYKCTPTALAPDDPIDGEYTDDNCDGSDGVVAKCLFVASDGIDAPGAGTRTAPMKTVAYAISQAKNRRMNVCLSGERYTGEVDMVGGVSVYGGFNEHDHDFAFRRSASTPTTLSAKGTVVLAAGIDVDTHLAGLVIEAGTEDSAAGVAGKGTYGVRLVGGLGTLFVRYDVITTSAGQDGANGKAGFDGDPGVNGADGENGCNGCGSSEAPNPPGGAHGGAPPMSTCGGGSGGAGGQGGYDQTAGNGGGNGTGANSSDGGGGFGNSTCGVSGGGDGADGQSPTEPGKVGTDGAAGQAMGALDANAIYTPTSAGDGASGAPGNAGGGGGGGGGGTNGGLCKGDRGSGGGSGATGGCPGTSGTGAQGGGASFAVAARAGKLVVGGNKLQAGKGGNGGAGGAGGKGGIGGKGGAGKGRNDDGGASGKGGDGSGGGNGGNGGGGAGGPSACIATATGVVLDETPTNSCTAFGGGTGGPGGNNAPNNGQDGVSQPDLKLR